MFLDVARCYFWGFYIDMRRPLNHQCISFSVQCNIFEAFSLFIWRMETLCEDVTVDEAQNIISYKSEISEQVLQKERERKASALICAKSEWRTQPEG